MLYKRCGNCGRLNPTNSVVCQYCSVSLGRYRVCSRGHKNRWDAQFCGICGDVFLSPASPVALPLRSVVKGFFLLVALFVLGYFLWEHRTVVFLSLALLLALLYFTGWLLRPFGRAVQLWMPWIFLVSVHPEAMTMLGREVFSQRVVKEDAGIPWS